jgi:hypothetical protein
MIKRQLAIQPERPHCWKQSLIATGVLMLLGYRVWGEIVFLGGPIPALIVLAVVHHAALAIKSAEIQGRIMAQVAPALQAMAKRPLKKVDVGCAQSPTNKMHFGGTGIACDGECILVMDQGEVALIPWADVRSWEWRLEGYNRTQAIGGILNPHTASIALQNAVDKQAAAVESGFFVRVADIDKPVWHFQSTDRRTLERWQEIFEQMNEGRLAAAE